MIEDNADLIEEAGVVYLTAADIAMLKFAMNVPADWVDFDESAFFLDDDE